MLAPSEGGCYDGSVDPTYGEKLSVPPHRSFFRDALAQRAAPQGVQEYLIEQANARGFLGAYTAASELPAIDENLDLEDIVVGLLQPQAPAEVRVIKLVVRILQSGRLDLDRLLLRARRERADASLAWILEIIPEVEVGPPVRALRERSRERPPRETRRPAIRYDPRRLLGPRARNR